MTYGYPVGADDPFWSEPPRGYVNRPLADRDLGGGWMLADRRLGVAGYHRPQVAVCRVVVVAFSQREASPV
jgi:hypothetical protein